MRLRDNPHIARQDRTQLLQSVAFTPGTGKTGTGKTHLAIGLAMRACQAGHRVLFATAAEWVARLAEAHHGGRIQQELTRLGRYPLLVVDESATSRSKPRPPTCSSNWCRPAMNGPA